VRLDQYRMVSRKTPDRDSCRFAALFGQGHPIHMEFAGAASGGDPYSAAFLREMARVAEYASFFWLHWDEALIAKLDRADAAFIFHRGGLRSRGGGSVSRN